MSGPADEKGGKSSKMPTLSTPALVISSSPSAAAGRAARTRPSAKTKPGAKARRRNNDFFMGPPWERGARRSTHREDQFRRDRRPAQSTAAVPATGLAGAPSPAPRESVLFRPSSPR